MNRLTTAEDSRAVSVEDVEALRGPLTGYCYRLLGGSAETDDAVQDTLIRAERYLDRYDPTRGRLTTWVFRIATRVCLDVLRSARRRELATDLGPGTAGEASFSLLEQDSWVEPMPSTRLLAGDPAETVIGRDTVRLAFVAALQRLPPRQRAVLVLRDVLAFSAAEAAATLDTSIAAVNSALQRARARLADNQPVIGEFSDPDDPAQQELLSSYVAAFEAHDVEKLTSLLREDALATMPPVAWWLRGGREIATLMATTPDCAHDRLVRVEVNGFPGFGQYRPDDEGVLRPFALIHVDVVDGRVARLTTYLDAANRFGEFGLPEKV